MGRVYRQQQRAEDTEERREAILEAAFRLFARLPFEDVSLARVAAEAGVSTRTVTRAFGTKDGLILACMAAARPREEAARAVPPGDLNAIADVLADRYELIHADVPAYDALALRIPRIAEWIQLARESHLAWLEQVFAPWMPEDAVERRQRVLTLFFVTEIRAWHGLRAHLGADRAAARRALHDTLGALVRSWATVPDREVP